MNINPDHLNTPRVITNQASQVVWRWDHTEPFGADPANSNPSGLGAFEFNLRLPGQYFDKETNLHYNYFRDYDPAIGRYIQSDPIGLRAGVNTYAYVKGNPLVYADPYGLWTWPTPSDVINYWGEVGGAAGDFYRNWNDLTNAGQTMVQNLGPGGAAGADKYFHCMANCQAAQRGPAGEDAACVISNIKEWRDQNIKGYPPSDSVADQQANQYGRNQGSINRTPCSLLCDPYRPPGLPRGY